MTSRKNADGSHAYGFTAPWFESPKDLGLLRTLAGQYPGLTPSVGLTFDPNTEKLETTFERELSYAEDLVLDQFVATYGEAK